MKCAAIIVCEMMHRDGKKGKNVRCAKEATHEWTEGWDDPVLLCTEHAKIVAKISKFVKPIKEKNVK